MKLDFMAAILASAVMLAPAVVDAGEGNSRLAVTVSQTGASIFLDGKLLGQSPLDTVTGLEPGEHTLEVKLKGFRTFRKKVELKPGDVTQVSAFLQARVGGKLVISSITKDATVFIDDFEIGRVPLVGPVFVEPGKHEIKVTKLGFTAFSQVVEVKKGRTVKVRADLLAFAGILDVRANVSGAKVLVDGEEIGVVPLEKEVFAGVHKVEVVKPGHSGFEQELTVSAGKSYSIMAELEPIAQESQASTGAGEGAAAGNTQELEAEHVQTVDAGKEKAVELPAPPPPGAETGEETGAWYTKWWLWTAVAVVVAVAVAVPVGMEQTSGSGGGTKLPHTDVPDIRLP